MGSSTVDADEALDARVREIVDAWPPLSAEQCARLSFLLTPAMAPLPGRNKRTRTNDTATIIGVCDVLTLTNPTSPVDTPADAPAAA